MVALSFVMSQKIIFLKGFGDKEVSALVQSRFPTQTPCCRVKGRSSK